MHNYIDICAVSGIKSTSHLNDLDFMIGMFSGHRVAFLACPDAA